MSILRGIVAAGAMVWAINSAWADNTVVVESQTVCQGAKGVTVGVLLSNDSELRHVTVPLEVRSAKGGAFITSLRMSWGDRMPPGKKTPLGENAFANQYHTRDCTCGKGKVSGYGTISFADTLAHPVKESPVGMLFSRFRMMGANLIPGQDSTGSILLTMDIGANAGTFEIDTTCVCPSHTLMFVEVADTPLPIFPAFTKGVVTVKACKDGK